MNTIFYLKLYLTTLAAFLAIDMLWLGVVARGFYRAHLGFLMRSSPNWAAAMIFYLLFIIGLLYFVVIPALQARSPGKALLAGALFGLFTYATYDLTNLATLKDWPVLLTIVDIGWGIGLSMVVAWIAYWVGARLA